MKATRAAAAVWLTILSPQRPDLLPTELLWGELDRKAEARQLQNAQKFGNQFTKTTLISLMHRICKAAILREDDIEICVYSLDNNSCF